MTIPDDGNVPSFKKREVMDNVRVNSHIYYMNSLHIIMK